MVFSSKNIFFVSISFAIFFSCSIGGFYVWSNYQLKKEDVARKVARKERLTKYYIDQFCFSYEESYYGEKQNSLSRIKRADNVWDKATNNMYKEGFDGEEISSIISKGYDKYVKWRRLRAKIKDKDKNKKNNKDDKNYDK